MDQWTGKDGLISNNLTSVNQSSSKFIWVTSFNGILRFDGVDFKLYDKSNLPFLQSNGFYKSFEDSRGNLWFVSQSSGVINYSGNTFNQVLSSEHSSHSVRCIAEDRDGKIWFGTNNEGVFIVKDSTLEKVDLGEFNAIPIMDIKVNSKGQLLFATNGAGILSYKNNQIEQYSTTDGLNNNSVNKLVMAPDGSIYAGTFDGIYQFSERGNKRISQFDGLEINDLYIDDYNNLWAGTEQGLYKLNLTDNSFDNFTEAEGLPANQISSLCFDHENSLWLSTKKAGLVRLRIGFFKNITNVDGLSSNNVNIIVENNNKYYVGCDDGKISVVDGKNVSQLAMKSTFFNIGIRDINFSEDGEILVASYRGLTAIKNGKESFIDLNQYGASSDVRRILRGKDGTIWLGTRSSGVVKYVNSKNVTLYNSVNGLKSDYILALEETDNGDIYVGTHSGGLSLIKKSGKVVNYPIEDGKAGILIFNIQILPDNNLWLATNVGVYKFANETIRRINLDPDLKAETIFDVIVENDNAWLSTNLGVIRVSVSDLDKYIKGELSIVSGKMFDRYDGMASQECTGATRMTLGSDGKIWIPTLGGVALLDPKNIHTNESIPKVYITEFRSDFKERELVNEQPIVIDAGTLRYEFHFTSLSYIAPPKVKFKYRLKGIDRDWIDTGIEREALYTNLPYGDYEFAVIASNNDGIWNDQGAVLKFRVEPFFYETTLFYILLIAVIGLIIWGIFIWRVHNIERVNAELRKLNEELDRFVYSASHDLRAPLSSVLGLVEIARLEPTISAKDECLGMINVSIQKLDGFINDIIDYSRNQRIDIQPDHVDIEKEVNDVFDDLKFLDKDGRIEKSVTQIEKRDFITDGRRLSVILKNLISNSIRYHDLEKDNPFIKVEILYKANIAIIIVKDNGIGIDSHHLENIFKMFYRADETSKGSGLGLYIVKETVDKLNGKIEVSSRKNEGTTFTLTIPLLKSIK